MTTFDYLRFLFCLYLAGNASHSWFGGFRELGWPTRRLVGRERRAAADARPFPLARASWVIRKVYGIS